jgi:hypothetical protein
MRLISACLLVFVSAVTAERPPQQRSDADVVLTGIIEKISTRDVAFGGDGVNTTYTATVKITKVTKGDLKVGDTVQVSWFHVTKSPTCPLPGAYGQDHKLAVKDEATFWLLGDKAPYTVLYNRDGVEKLPRPK